MSSSPTFIVSQTKEVEEEERLAIGPVRSHTSSPRSRPSSRLEILMMDLVRSQAEMARSQGDMARSQEDLVQSQEESKQKLESLARSQAEQSQSTKERLADSERSRICIG